MQCLSIFQLSLHPSVAGCGRGWGVLLRLVCFTGGWRTLGGGWGLFEVAAVFWLLEQPPPCSWVLYSGICFLPDLAFLLFVLLFLLNEWKCTSFVSRIHVAMAVSHSFKGGTGTRAIFANFAYHTDFTLSLRTVWWWSLEDHSGVSCWGQ